MKLGDLDFRVWDKNERKYLYFGKDRFNLCSDKNNAISFDALHYIKTNKFEDFENLEIEFWSGHCDKNGTKIYEGDVVKIIYKKDEDEYIAKVIFTLRDGFKIDDGSIDLFKPNSLELIGNIHDKAEEMAILFEKKFTRILFFCNHFEKEYYEKELFKKYKSNYYTILKLINEMFEKGFIQRNDKVYIQSNIKDIFFENSRIFIINKALKDEIVIHLRFKKMNERDKKNFCHQIYGTKDYKDIESISNIIFKDITATGNAMMTPLEMKETKTILKNCKFKEIIYGEAYDELIKYEKEMR